MKTPTKLEQQLALIMAERRRQIKELQRQLDERTREVIGEELVAKDWELQKAFAVLQAENTPEAQEVVMKRDCMNTSCAQEEADERARIVSIETAAREAAEAVFAQKHVPTAEVAAWRQHFQDELAAKSKALMSLTALQAENERLLERLKAMDRLAASGVYITSKSLKQKLAENEKLRADNEKLHKEVNDLNTLQREERDAQEADEREYDEQAGLPGNPADYGNN